MNKYNFIINMDEEYTKPIPSPRPRFSRFGTYMPADYTAHKKWIKQQLPDLTLDGVLEVEINFYFPPLKSWSKKKKAESIETYKKTKPDIDNLIKTVLDACNGHVWVDDNQIAKITSTKKYDANARVEINITEV